MYKSAWNVGEQFKNVLRNMAPTVLPKQGEGISFGVPSNVLPETQSGSEDGKYLQYTFAKDGSIAVEHDMRCIMTAKKRLCLWRQVSLGKYCRVLRTKLFQGLS
jgi:hypothetical protein